MRDRLTAGQQTLNLLIMVRIHVPQDKKILTDMNVFEYE